MKWSVSEAASLVRSGGIDDGVCPVCRVEAVCLLLGVNNCTLQNVDLEENPHADANFHA